VLTQEQSDRFTQVGPGTPMGELLRRYWQPISATVLLEKDPVQPVRLLGEDLVLFRSERGELGLIGDRCAHRGISMAYGIPQENGLRCAYHGWTYDTNGRTVDTPFEPTCLHMKIPAYPVQELAGMIWAYLGPTPAPELPKWDALMRDDLEKKLRVTHLDCNWLQCMDNSLDPSHFEHLHGVYGNYMMKKLGRPPMLNPARHLKIDFDVFEFGIYKRRLTEGMSEDAPDWTVGHPILFPNILAQGGPGQMSWQFRVPMDDTHTLHMVLLGSKPEPGKQGSALPEVFVEELNFDGLGRVFADHIVVQDEAAWIGQGPISDRYHEHLASSDKGILLYRKLLEENMQAVEHGDDPMGLIRDKARNETAIEIKRGSTYESFREGIDAETYGGNRNAAEAAWATVRQ
jgi:5,5'-dehydrodivanillate O-demethylase oxygenase subunit